MKLGYNKGSTNDTDNEAEQQERFVAVGKTSAHYRNSAQRTSKMVLG